MHAAICRLRSMQPPDTREGRRCTRLERCVVRVARTCIAGWAPRAWCGKMHPTRHTQHATHSAIFHACSHATLQGCPGGTGSRRPHACSQTHAPLKGLAIQIACRPLAFSLRPRVGPALGADWPAAAAVMWEAGVTWGWPHKGGHMGGQSGSPGPAAKPTGGALETIPENSVSRLGVGRGREAGGRGGYNRLSVLRGVTLGAGGTRRSRRRRGWPRAVSRPPPNTHTFGSARPHGRCRAAPTTK